MSASTRPVFHDPVFIRFLPSMFSSFFSAVDKRMLYRRLFCAYSIGLETKLTCVRRWFLCFPILGFLKKEPV